MNTTTMSKDATKLQAAQAHDSSTVLLKKIRHDKHVSNQGRIKASHQDENGNLLKPSAYTSHESRLKFLAPYLESLPDTKLLHPAKKLAGVIFTCPLHANRGKKFYQLILIQ